jgi:hypothetical protein
MLTAEPPIKGGMVPRGDGLDGGGRAELLASLRRTGAVGEREACPSSIGRRAALGAQPLMHNQQKVPGMNWASVAQTAIAV